MDRCARRSAARAGRGEGEAVRRGVAGCRRVGREAACHGGRAVRPVSGRDADPNAAHSCTEIDRERRVVRGGDAADVAYARCRRVRDRYVDRRGTRCSARAGRRIGEAVRPVFTGLRRVGDEVAGDARRPFGTGAGQHCGMRAAADRAGHVDCPRRPISHGYAGDVRRDRDIGRDRQSALGIGENDARVRRWSSCNATSPSARPVMR